MPEKTPKSERIDKWYANKNFTNNFDKIKWPSKEKKNSEIKEQK